MYYVTSPSFFHIQSVVEHTHMSPDMFVLYLHQNYVDFYENVEDIVCLYHVHAPVEQHWLRLHAHHCHYCVGSSFRVLVLHTSVMLTFLVGCGLIPRWVYQTSRFTWLILIVFHSSISLVPRPFWEWDYSGTREHIMFLVYNISYDTYQN